MTHKTKTILIAALAVIFIIGTSVIITAYNKDRKIAGSDSSTEHVNSYRSQQDSRLKLGKRDKVIKEYQQKLKENPSSAMYHYLYSRVLDDPDAAIKELQKSLQLNPDYFWTHYGLGYQYMQAGNIKEAEAGFKKAVSINPELWLGYFQLGYLYVTEEKYKEAEAEFKKALGFNPDDKRIHNNLGWMYYLDDKSGEAIEEIKKALNIDANYVQALGNLGSIYCNEKQYEKAIEVFKKILTLAPDNAFAHWGLATCYHFRPEYVTEEDAKLALAEYHKAIELGYETEVVKHLDEYNISEYLGGDYE